MEKVSKQTILVIFIVLIGILIRTAGITLIPSGLNTDEASSGYEAYSIMKNGIDRNGHSLPVFLESWGSGQNALYTYLSIQFIAIFGLNTLSIRLPMAIMGSISLIVFYLLLKRILDDKKAIVGLIFLAICPWHIMKSRWGLESNIFPDLILYFVYFLVRGLQDKKKVFYYLSFVIAGLSAYAYGTSYLFLPLFIIPLLIVLKVKQEINIKEIVLSLLIVFLVSLPIILFVIINTFNLNEMKFLVFTIPHLETNRYKIITSLFNGDFIHSSFENIVNTSKIIVLQKDGLPWNSLNSLGTIYLFSTIFTVIGIINPLLDKIIAKRNSKKDEKKKKYSWQVEKNYSWIFAIWLIVSLIIGIVCAPNINRLNILFFPIIYFTVLGICFLIDYNNAIKILLLIIYLVYFGLFVGTYLRENYSSYDTFEGNLKEVFDYVNELNKDEGKYYFVITDGIREPYIYTLFYTKYDSKDFNKTKQFVKGTEHIEFRQVESFGNFGYGINVDIPEDKIPVYIFKESEITGLDYDVFDVKKINDYLVITEK